VLNFLEGHPHIATEQLLPVPMGPRIRSDHRGRQNRLDNSCHVDPLVTLACFPDRHAEIATRRLYPLCEKTFAQNMKF
jgi:hypothetical protein